MREITDGPTITAMMREKQALEIRLAWGLLEIFNHKDMDLIKPLRKMVKLSVDAMDGYATSADRLKRGKFLNLWNTDWGAPNKYAVVSDNHLPRPWNSQAVRAAAPNFIAQHCADWIRIYGEVLEKVDPQGTADNSRTRLQKGGAYHWDKYDGRNQGPQLDKGRRRVLGQFRKNEGVMPDYAQQSAEDTRLYRSKQAQALGGTQGPIRQPEPATSMSVWGFMRDMTPGGGLGRWQVMQGDTTGKVDQVFGLMPGATISGTTTDNIYFFKRFGGLRMDPIFYLLPAATIVAGGHHSLGEVGLPLMLNRINEYRVGLYTTLFPTRTNSAGAPVGVSALKNQLTIAQNHGHNHLMLIWYAGGSQPAGCLLYESPQDKAAWARMKIGTEFMSVFQSLLPWPRKAQVAMHLKGRLSL